MPHQTRRAAREAAAQDTTRARPSSKRPAASRKKAWRIAGLTIGIVAVVGLSLAVWVAFKALTVKSSLEAAQGQIASVQDGGDMSTALATIGERAQTAADAANDPVWRVLEFVPVAGDNLRAVRLASETLDTAVNDIGAPVLALQADGQGKILSRALPVLAEGAKTLEPLAAELAAVAQSPSLIGPVRSGVDQVNEVMAAAQPMLSLLPELLGAEADKRYLLVFQNNAESLPLGGSAASQTLITVSDGDLEIAAQASSASFGEDALVDVDLPESEANLYGVTLGRRINMSTTIPDWPAAARLITAFWQRDIDEQPLDGVISIDPLALSRMLLATGPITVGDVTIDQSNAVQILLSDVYEWWNAYTPEGAVASDAFFASVAAAMFEKVASGDFDLKDMAWAVNESVAQGSILAWMSDDQAQAVLEQGRAAGVLPTDNTDGTTVGVYFRDVSASKIDYYMNSGVDASLTCSADDATLTVSATLTLDISQADADALPPYVKSKRQGSSFFTTQVFVYAPPGMEVESVDVDGRQVASFREGNVDLGRVVAPFQMMMRPSETVTVTATFTGEGRFGPLDVRTTPMVRTTNVSATDGCG